VSIPGAKTVTKEIANNRRPDEQHHGNPDKAHVRIIESAKKDIAQYHNHQADIDNHAKQADGEEPVELAQFRKKQKYAHQAETNYNGHYRADFFPGIHGSFLVMGIPAVQLTVWFENGPGRVEAEAIKLGIFDNKINRPPTREFRDSVAGTAS